MWDLVGEREGKRSLGSPRRRREENVKTGARWGSIDWIHLAQDRDQWKALVNTVMNHRVPH
jgi:hypothetical protein